MVLDAFARIAPENPIAQSLMTTSKFARRVAEQARIRDAKEQANYDLFTSVDESASQVIDDREVIRFAKNWSSLSGSRL